jgi:hypothetical protein
MHFLKCARTENPSSGTGCRAGLARWVPLVSVFCGLAAPGFGAGQPASAGLSSLSIDAQSSISAAMGRDIPGYQAKTGRAGIEAGNARQRLAMNFTTDVVEVSSGTQHWKMALRAYGYGDALHPVKAAAPTASFNRVVYKRGGLTEWYLNGPVGLEQGITLQKSPGQADGRPLTIEFMLKGDLTAEVDEPGTGLMLTRADGKTELRYRGLLAYDASGRKLPAWLEVKDTFLLLKVDDAQARYPVVIDPFVQMGELTASDGATNAEFGDSVSISGNTVVAGAPGCLGCGFVGAAYVFTEPAKGWGNMTQTAKLTASDGEANNQFGFAVSVNGGTIAVGSHASDGTRGAVYVYTQPANGWTNMTETAKLTASDSVPGDLVGRSVSVSGNTVVAGAPQAMVGTHKQQGTAYVFVEPAGGWTKMTQTAKLTASDGLSYGEMGYSISVDGNTVVAGAPSPVSGRNYSPGSAYVFVEPVGGWTNTTQTAKLTGSDTANGNRLGNFVGISGNTVVAGAPLATPGSKPQQGAAYVFVEPTGGWANMTQTAKLTSSDGVRNGYFGRAVAISGNAVVVGAPNQMVNSAVGEGAVYEFLEPDGGWTSMTETVELNALHAGKSDEVGCRVSVDGVNAVAGALGGNKRGAVFVFADLQ